MITKFLFLFGKEYRIELNTAIPSIDDFFDKNEDILKVVIGNLAANSKSNIEYAQAADTFSLTSAKNVLLQPNIDFPIAFRSQFYTYGNYSTHLTIPLAIDTKSATPRINDDPMFFKQTALARLLNKQFATETADLVKEMIQYAFDKIKYKKVTSLQRKSVNLNLELLFNCLREDQLEIAYLETENPIFLNPNVRDIFIF